MSIETLAPRERILKVSGGLFYENGYRAIGVDRIIKESGVAKATFYKHFPSKTDLMVAWVERAEAMAQDVTPSDEGSATPLTDYADAMIDLAANSWCMGCTYQGLASEFADPAHPAHAAAMGVKQRVIETLNNRAGKQGCSNPDMVAEQVFLFLEGVWASVRMFRGDAPLGHAKQAVRALLSA